MNIYAAFVLLVSLALIVPAQADEHCIVLRSHEESVRLTVIEAERILEGVRKILCGCAERAGAACNLTFKVDGEIRPFLEKGATPPELDPDEPNLADNILLLRHLEGHRSVYLVKKVKTCDNKAPPGLSGCSKQPGPAIVVSLSVAAPGSNPSRADANEYRNQDWYDTQSKLWAHELGHNLGLKHNEGDEEDLMNSSIPYLPRISPAECSCFLAPFSYKEGCPSNNPVPQMKPKQSNISPGSGL